MYSIEEGETKHAKEMHNIEAECFAMPWSEMSIEFELKQKHTISFVAIQDKRVVGHIYMRHIINEGHITNLAVKKTHRKNGIGYSLVNKLISTAKEMEMIGITLEVRESNKPAISLYKKHGFLPEGVRKNYYSNPTENGIIMWNYFKDVNV